MNLELKAKHFLHTQYLAGNGPIKEALQELYPGKRISQGVELTNVAGKHWYHKIYSRELYERGLSKAIYSNSDPETIIETITLSETYK